MDYWNNIDLKELSETINDKLITEEWKDIIGYVGFYQYSCIKEAALKLNLCAASIIKICRGEYTQTRNGLKFKYL